MTAESSVRLTSGEVSRLASVPLQTLIRWDRSGVLKAVRLGRRSSGTARRYDLNGLIAALFARNLTAMGFLPMRLPAMIQVMQRADEKALREWAIYSCRVSPGLMMHDCGELTEGMARNIDTLREQGRLLDGPTDLWTVREGLVEIAHGFLAMRGALGPLKEED